MSYETSCNLIAGVSEDEISDPNVDDDDLIPAGSGIGEYCSGCMVSGDGVKRYCGVSIVDSDIYEASLISEDLISDALREAKEKFRKIGIDVEPKIYLVMNYG